jgi:hypothetical protein
MIGQKYRMIVQKQKQRLQKFKKSFTLLFVIMENFVEQNFTFCAK